MTLRAKEVDFGKIQIIWQCPECESELEAPFSYKKEFCKHCTSSMNPIRALEKFDNGKSRWKTVLNIGNIRTIWECPECESEIEVPFLDGKKHCQLCEEITIDMKSIEMLPVKAVVVRQDSR